MGENKNFGVELGYLYESPVLTLRVCIPSVWLGSRAPHVFLQGGRSVFDRFGRDWTLVTFSADQGNVKLLMDAAEALSVLVKHVDLEGGTPRADYFGSRM
ncbi:hypothetical protein T440DRAFT_471522 [Plenodomus tracheiphilus IPT5]|uniref:Uncharacterized protein n=1 Tax=Plenodomus tracheiphilus IPT5 TaxID=1408161 RepID=A0A6A7AXD1_9PLEO|nr:hypothetical protein T440DRAFT_471522 [Plenodomus tracheiphilus IPT5]